MVQENAKRFSTDEIEALIEDNMRVIKRLSTKFWHFTYLNKQDLIQEGCLKIVELCRKYEEGTINVPYEDFHQYLGRALVNHYIRITKQKPSDECFDPKIFEYSRGENVKLFDDVMFLTILEQELTPDEEEACILKLCGYKEFEIGEFIGISKNQVKSLFRRLRKKINHTDI
jgi:RNA polymerase sigma factor (sigma-70 family)